MSSGSSNANVEQDEDVTSVDDQVIKTEFTVKR